LLDTYYDCAAAAIDALHSTFSAGSDGSRYPDHRIDAVEAETFLLEHQPPALYGGGLAP
jgi:hypothetical protein